MNAPLPASLSRAEAEGDRGLDERIRRVEQRLIAREENLRRGIAHLGGDLRERLRPGRWLLPVGGGLLAAAAVLALWRRPAAHAAEHVAAARPPGARLPWVQLVGFAWPLLPERWRARVSPTVVNSVMTLGLPLVEALLGSRRVHEPLQTVAEVDLARLSGRWFIVGELPAGEDTQDPPELGLLPRDDGQFDLLQRRGPDGSEARAQPVPDSHGSRLRISHWPEALRWLPQAWVEHGVLHIDAGYDEALIGSSSRDALWMLSRRPTLAPERRQVLARIAADRGFAVERLRLHDAG